MHRNSSIEEYFLGLSYLGVNRISVGAQSFDDISKRLVGLTVCRSEFFLGGVQNFYKCEYRYDVRFARANQIKVREDIDT